MTKSLNDTSETVLGFKILLRKVPMKVNSYNFKVTSLRKGSNEISQDDVEQRMKRLRALTVEEDRQSTQAEQRA